MKKLLIDLNLSGMTKRTDAVIAKVMDEKNLNESEAILFLLQKAYKPNRG